MRQKDILFGSRSTSQIVEQAPPRSHAPHRARTNRRCPMKGRIDCGFRSWPVGAAQPRCILLKSMLRRSTAGLMPETTTSHTLRFKPAGRPDMRTRTYDCAAAVGRSDRSGGRALPYARSMTKVGMGKYRTPVTLQATRVVRRWHERRHLERKERTPTDFSVALSQELGGAGADAANPHEDFSHTCLSGSAVPTFLSALCVPHRRRTLKMARKKIMNAPQPRARPSFGGRSKRWTPSRPRPPERRGPKTREETTSSI